MTKAIFTKYELTWGIPRETENQLVFWLPNNVDLLEHISNILKLVEDIPDVEWEIKDVEARTYRMVG